MTLTHAWVLHLLWILPIAGFALIVQRRNQQLTLDNHQGKRFVKDILLLCALALMVLALSGPRWGSSYQEVSRKGVDIMILIDVSRSMMVEDVKPNRLERARREIIDFLKVVEGDRVGLTAFAGAAFVQCPLTLDYGALKMFLKTLQPGIIPVPGTNMGVAIETGLSAFDFKTETDKVMLLITDGEDNENSGLKAAGDAAGQGVKIFVFGIGDLSGGPIPAGSKQGGFKKDKDGKLVLSKLDEKTLRDIASVADGGYVRSVAGDLDLDILYFDGIKKKTEAQILKSGKIKVYEERFNLFVLAGFLLLFIEELIDDKRKPVSKKSKKRFGFLIGLAIYSLVYFFPPNSASATDPPDELYRQGRYEEAGKAYAEGDMNHPRDIRYRYNRGCAAFQNGQYKEASAAFSSVMKRTQDRDMLFKSAYNLGNTAFKQGDFESAALYYKKALVNNPSSTDARCNLELSLRTLKKMKQKQKNSKTDKTEKKNGEKKEGENKKSGDSGQRRNKDQNKETQKKGQDKESTQKDENKKHADGSKPDKNRNKDQKAAQGAKPEADAAENPEGELKPLQAMPELKQKNNALNADKSAIDKKKAKALLDNVQEDPSGIMRFMIPEKNRAGAASGRDW
ncbi:MAG: VWA domain-containing protein [Deltaproteobacteria bacterium]|nr:VWA domain-containing protein [Deltaproteobacteria bacterium]